MESSQSYRKSEKERIKNTDRLTETYMWQSSNFNSLGLLEEKSLAVFKTNRSNK